MVVLEIYSTDQIIASEIGAEVVWLNHSNLEIIRNAPKSLAAFILYLYFVSIYGADGRSRTGTAFATTPSR